MSTKLPPARWNIQELIAKHGMDTVTDFEHMAFGGGEELLKLCYCDGTWVWDLHSSFGAGPSSEHTLAVRDIGLNILGEIAQHWPEDTTQASKEEQMHCVFHTVSSILSCNHWVKSGLPNVMGKPS